MTQNLSQRVDAIFSNLAMIGLLSPLVLAAINIVVSSH
jgi:hypothetical protein